MLTNYHTHTTFCDGADSVEDVVLSAIEKGFDALGFSGHARTQWDDDGYTLRDMSGYMAAVNAAKEKYKDKIEIYLGIEEEDHAPVDRTEFEYIIGSVHHLPHKGRYYPLDSSYPKLLECLEAFGGDPLALAESYYRLFTAYILARKPDIVGHFDLITKFDEKNAPLFFGNAQYDAIAEKYLREAIKSECFFEVNTGAISRGCRFTPYPKENLLHVLKQTETKIVLCSDSHAKESLDCHFPETRKLLRDVGFQYVYALRHGQWVKDYLE